MPVDTKGKKKGGCLKLLLVLLVLFIGLVIIGAVFQQQSEEEWKDQRAAVLPRLRQAVDEGRAQDALDLVRRYETVKDTELQSLIRKAEAQLDYERAKLRAEREHQRALQEQQKAEQLAQTEAVKTMPQRIMERLHNDLGIKEKVLAGDKKWCALRNVDYDPEQRLASVSFDSKGGAKYLVYDAVADVIQSLLHFDAVDAVSVQVFTEYMDGEGNLAMLPWINARLTREAAEKVNWKNLRDYDKVEQFLRERGELRNRE